MELTDEQWAVVSQEIENQRNERMGEAGHENQRAMPAVGVLWILRLGAQ